MQARPRSERIFQEAAQVLPGGVNSPVRAFPGLPISPLVVESGSGAMIKDADGHTYIDYCGSWGALILGHNHPAIMSAVHIQLAKGTSFGITTAIETEFAQLINRLYPSMQKLRFVSSGTEATMTAIRLARGFTGKPTVVKFEGNYHGHTDCLLVKAGSGVANLPESSSAGVPQPFVQHTICLPYNNAEMARQLLRSRSDIACVIVEPVAGNMGVVAPEPGFLETLREETERCGALLIFDEVITGFRVALRGMQGLRGIAPDLTCLGKIIGGGFPAAAFGGRAEIMNELAPLGRVYQAGTLSGFPVAMAAGKAAIEQVQREGFYRELEEKAARFVAPIVAAVEERGLPVHLQRVGSMMTLFLGKTRDTLDKEAFRALFLHLFENGIYIPPLQQEAWFISSAHTEEQLRKTARAILDFFDKYYGENFQVLLTTSASGANCS